MGNLIDLAGKKFGRLTVLGVSHKTNGRFYWSCKCSCGSEATIWGADLKRGMTKSCGCLMREGSSARSTKHGLSRHPAYRTFIYMHNRCENPGYDGYALYGGRGIKVCQRWNSFENFWKDMGPSWRSGLSIDRRDVNSDYKPSNCYWATPQEQANNRRSNHLVQTKFGLLPVTEAAVRHGINPRSVFARIRYGWPEEKLFEAVRKRKF